MNSDTWTCHICGDERPDARISVLSKERVFHGTIVVNENVRYCNDRIACIEGAKEFSFIKEDMK